MSLSCQVSLVCVALQLWLPLSIIGYVGRCFWGLCQTGFVFQWRQEVWIKELTNWFTHRAKPMIWEFMCVCANVNESTLIYKHVTVHAVKECDRTCSSNLCAWANSRGLRLQGDYHREASSTHGRLAMFSLWWRSAPQSPKYPDEKVTGRSGNGSILTGGEMGWPIPQGDLISFNVSLRVRSAVRLWMKR